MGLVALLSLPLPVILAFAAVVLVMLLLGWAVAGLRRPGVVRAPAPSHPAGRPQD